MPGVPRAYPAIMASMDVPRLAVTGSTGLLGGRVARRLAAAGTPQRLVVRDAARAPRLDGAQVAVASYGDAPAVRQALDGIDTVFMVSAAEDPNRVADHLTFLDAAVAAGVGHIVYVSFFGAAPDAAFTLARDHWATEQHLMATGVPHTILRDNLYQDFLPMLAGPDGVIRGPAEDGRVSAVAQDDVADVAAVVLSEPQRHDRLTYDLTGPEALTLAEIAGILTKAAGAGRVYSYHPETIEQAYASRARYGAPQWQVDAWVSTYTAIARGEMAWVSDAVPLVTGHPATSLAQLLARTS
jgi:NAD(P)H dehydrogenase (quinone)